MGQAIRRASFCFGGRRGRSMAARGASATVHSASDWIHEQAAALEAPRVENIALANFFGKQCDMRSKTMHEELIIVAHCHGLT